MLIRGPVCRVVLGTACSQVRWQLPPITIRSPWPRSWPQRRAAAARAQQQRARFAERRRSRPWCPRSSCGRCGRRARPRCRGRRGRGTARRCANGSPSSGRSARRARLERRRARDRAAASPRRRSASSRGTSTTRSYIWRRSARHGTVSRSRSNSTSAPRNQPRCTSIHAPSDSSVRCGRSGVVTTGSSSAIPAARPGSRVRSWPRKLNPNESATPAVPESLRLRIMPSCIGAATGPGAASDGVYGVRQDAGRPTRPTGARLAVVADGRSTLKHLAEATGLSVSAVQARVRRLEADGIIRGYAADVDPEALGLPLAAIIAITPRDPEHEYDIPDRLGRPDRDRVAATRWRATTASCCSSGSRRRWRWRR